MEDGLDLVLEAGVQAIRKKAVEQSEFLLELVQRFLIGHGFSLKSPVDPEKRGAQVTLAHPDAWPIVQALRSRKVIVDFRRPDAIRFGLASLYITYAEIHRAVAELVEIMETGEYQKYPRKIQGIT